MMSTNTAESKDMADLKESVVTKSAESVQKTGTGLNPNCDAFYYTKTLTTVEKSWEPGEEFLTNGDLKQDEVGRGFSSGDSPVSDNPPAPIIEPICTLDTGAPPQEFIPDPMVGTPAPVPLIVGAEAVPSMAVEEGAIASEQAVDPGLPQMALVASPQVVAPPAPIQNGIGVLHNGTMYYCYQNTRANTNHNYYCGGMSNPGPAHQEGSDGGPPEGQASEAASLPNSPSELRKQLLAQLEYYFSRENLVHDHYLQSQMDGDQYVQISTIANFNQVVKLTRDFNLIVEILRSSKLVQVGETGTKVRPKHNRSVLMLREIPETTSKAEVEELFNSDKCPKLVSCEFAHNGCWYITFNTDQDAFDAYVYLRQETVKFHYKPVLARIKAKPLVRNVGNSQFPPSKNASRQQQDQTVPYMRPLQPAYSVMPISQFQQQISQGLPMLAMNGYQDTSIKPSNPTDNHNLYPVRNNNRGMPKPQHRPQAANTDKVMDSRPLDLSHTNSFSTARASPRNSVPHTSESHPQPPPFARSHSEATAGNSNGHFSSQLQSSVNATPAALVPEESLPHHNPVQPTPSSKPDPISTPVQPKRVGGKYRRSRRNDEGAKNSRSNPSHGGKDGKAHKPHFELEATSFPPLPGSINNSSSSDAPEGNKLSDVVKGTARPHARVEDRVKATPTPSSTVTATPEAVPASVPAVTSVSVADTTSNPQTMNANAAMSLAAAVVVSTAASPVAKETDVSATPSFALHNVAPASATAVEPSAHPSKTSKTSSQSIPSGATKPVSEQVVVPKQATVSTAPAKQVHASAPAPAPTSAPTSVPAQTSADVAPAKLSYAQMVARKQQAENAAKQNTEEEVTPQAAAATPASRSATQTTLREQSQTQASASVSASAQTKSASASARPPAKEPPGKGFEPKEQRFQGGRRAKENRDSHQHRFKRRRNDRDVKVPAK